MAAVRVLDAAGIVPAGLGMRRPSLDEVFLSLTGRSTGEEDLAVPAPPTPPTPEPDRSPA
jgi:ABC-2 type transport system ATP-binding protein